MLKGKSWGRDFRLVVLNLVSVVAVFTFELTAAAEVPKLWEDDDKNIENLIQVAQNVSNLYPNSRFYGVGKRPSWIVKTMEVLSAEMPKKAGSFHHYYSVPFSEKFEEENRYVKNNYTVVQSKVLPNEENIKRYYRLLREIGLDPVEVHYQYEHFKRKTVLIDFTHNDRLVVLLTKIIMDLAKIYAIDLEEALEVITISQLNSILPVRLLFVDGGQTILICKNVFGDDHLLESLAKATEEDGPNSSNLLPDYSAKDWLKPVNLPPKNKRVNKIIKKITTFVMIYFKNIANVVVPETSTSSITLTAPPVGNHMPISLVIPSMSNGQESACIDLDFFTSGMYKNVDNSAKSEIRYLNIINEPLYLILTYNTTGVDTLNPYVYTLLTEEYSSTDMLEVYKRSLLDFIMESIGVEGSSARSILATVCKGLYSDYHSGLKNNFVEEVVKSTLVGIQSANKIDESTLILRTSPNDPSVPMEIDFQVPTAHLLPAFLSTCLVHLKNRRKRDLVSIGISEGHNDQLENFRDNPIYMILNWNTTDEYTLNGKTYKHLWAQHALSSLNKSKSESFPEFILEEIKNPKSLSSRILKEACSEKDRYDISDVGVSSTAASPVEDDKNFSDYAGDTVHYLGKGVCYIYYLASFYGLFHGFEDCKHGLQPIVH